MAFFRPPASVTTTSGFQSRTMSSRASTLVAASAWRAPHVKNKNVRAGIQAEDHDRSEVGRGRVRHSEVDGDIGFQGVARRRVVDTSSAMKP